MSVSEIVVDLPFPPSVNRVWRAQRTASGESLRVGRSPEYREWLALADRLALASKVCRGGRQIAGAFAAQIVLDGRRRRIDLDNGIKAVLDWAQRVRLIQNDKHCEEITIRWGIADEAPHGCRLTLRTAPSSRSSSGS